METPGNGGERPHREDPVPLGEILPEVLDEIETRANIHEHNELLKKSHSGQITPKEEKRLDELNAELRPPTDEDSKP